MRTEKRTSWKLQRKKNFFLHTFLFIFAAEYFWMPFNKLSHSFILCGRIGNRTDLNRLKNWFQKLAKPNTRLKPHESKAITMKNGQTQYNGSKARTHTNTTAQKNTSAQNTIRFYIYRILDSVLRWLLTNMSWWIGSTNKHHEHAQNHCKPITTTTILSPLSCALAEFV